MIILLVRIMILIGLVAGACFIVLKVLKPPAFVKCSRCEGKGFWLGARGREICNWCKGSGKLRREV